MTDLRPMTAAELPAALEFLERAFGDDPHPADQAAELGALDPANTLAVFDDGALLATAGWFDFSMTVPGRSAPVAGVTWVSVSPVHRRRGLLTAMMRRQLDDLSAAGRAVAALWASQGAIYQRFGYGPASWQHSVELPTRAPFVAPVAAGGLRLDEPTPALLAPVYEQVLPDRIGWYRREPAHWDSRLHDPVHRRAGYTATRCVLATEGADSGYALYSTQVEMGGPGGKVRVTELVASTPAAEARLWRYLLDLDLMTQLSAWGVAVDSPLLQLLAEPRAAKARVGDALWVRLVSVPDALAARRYQCDVDLVLAVTDPFCPWNTGSWRLSGGTEGAECMPTTAAPDLALDVRDLGAAYLGGTALVTRAASGGVHEATPGSLARASTAFGWAGRAAHCPMVF